VQIAPHLAKHGPSKRVANTPLGDTRSAGSRGGSVAVPSSAPARTGSRIVGPLLAFAVAAAPVSIVYRAIAHGPDPVDLATHSSVRVDDTPVAERGVVIKQYDDPRWLESSCTDGNARSCSRLSVRFARGQGVEQDLPRARELALVACEGGFEPACRNLYRENRRLGLSAYDPLQRQICRQGRALRRTANRPMP
jgi:hypothetical protein